MRLFIALEVPREVKEEIAAIQKKLKAKNILCRWTKPETTHLTLVFLGKTEPSKIGRIEKILREMSTQAPPVNLRLAKIDCFPSPAKAKIIHLSLKGELKKLNALVLKIQKALRGQKINFDQKPFVPHLTLGRLKKPQNLTWLLSKHKVPRREFFANHSNLIQSILTPQGPIYKTLASFELKPKS